MIYDGLRDKNTIVVIDARAMKVVATYPLSPHTGPDGLAMDPKTRRLFSATQSTSLLVLDADTGHILATFPIGARNDAGKFVPGTRLVFASQGDGTLAKPLRKQEVPEDCAATQAGGVTIDSPSRTTAKPSSPDIGRAVS